MRKKESGEECVVTLHLSFLIPMLGVSLNLALALPDTHSLFCHISLCVCSPVNVEMLCIPQRLFTKPLP